MNRHRLRFLLGIATLLSSLSFVSASALKRDEFIFFPLGMAYDSAEKNTVNLSISVWVYEKDSVMGFQKFLLRYLGIKPSMVSKEEWSRFQFRSALFQRDSERNKEVSIKFADGRIQKFPKTKKDGRAELNITLNRSLLQNNNITFSLVNGKNHAQGRVLYLSPKGILVISDIDDTIKDSQVLDTKALLRNTFFYEYSAVEGMSDFYRHLERTRKNVSFHYLSSSPLQLYEELSSFLSAEKFPQGMMHLRESTRWDRIIASKKETIAHKTRQIELLLQRFPQRKVIFIGDSGEKDPEIYHSFLNDYRERIEGIYIRNVTNESYESRRYQSLISSQDSKKWIIFEDPLPMF